MVKVPLEGVLLGLLFLLELLPLPGGTPDLPLLFFLALTLLPSRKAPPFLSAFLLGLLLDVVRGAPLGQTALVDLLLLYLTLLLRPYLFALPLPARLVYIYLAQLLAGLITALLGLARGAFWLTPDLWTAALLGTLLFLPISLSLKRLDLKRLAHHGGK